MNRIRFIETVYNGCRFRSRGEARWAIFFDVLGIPYEYEPDGFELGDGIGYVPDFWLPDQNCWVEIKPPRKWDYRPECDLLAKQSNCRLLLYITGYPWPGEYGIVPYPRESVEGEYPSFFALGNDDLWIRNNHGGAVCLNPVGFQDDSYPLDDSPQMIKAYRAARQMDFDCGVIQ